MAFALRESVCRFGRIRVLKTKLKISAFCRRNRGHGEKIFEKKPSMCYNIINDSGEKT